MMNWITFCCVAVFLSCQYSVGHGEGENFGGSSALYAGYFYENYYDLVAPVIQKKLGCDDMELSYGSGGQEKVCIDLRSSSLVFC